jgi:hypothetical protein
MYMCLISSGANPNPLGYVHMYDSPLIYVLHQFKYSYGNNVWSQARPRYSERLEVVSIIESLCFSIDRPREYMYLVNKTILGSLLIISTFSTHLYSSVSPEGTKMPFTMS